MTSDEERQRIAEALGLKHKLATRNDIKTFVDGCVQALIRGEKAEPEPDTEIDETPCEEAEAIRNRSFPGFVPSRGDEDYMFKANDPELKDILSRMLDVSEEYDQYIWRKLEGIREPA